MEMVDICSHREKQLHITSSYRPITTYYMQIFRGIVRRDNATKKRRKQRTTKAILKVLHRM